MPLLPMGSTATVGARADPAARIHSLDVLRGLALFGMIVVHFHVHSAELAGVDELIRAFIWRFIESKSHGTFALLFGAGFAIQLSRVETRGLPAIGNPLSVVFSLVQDQWLTFTYVGTAVLLFAEYPRWLSRLRPVALAGRMALTNYLLQIAVLDLMFAGYALQWNDIRPRYVPLAAGLLFAVEVTLSIVWLKRHRFGPAEWVWRSVTYGRLQPMRP